MNFNKQYENKKIDELKNFGQQEKKPSNIINLWVSKKAIVKSENSKSVLFVFKNEHNELFKFWVSKKFISYDNLTDFIKIGIIFSDQFSISIFAFDDKKYNAIATVSGPQLVTILKQYNNKIYFFEFADIFKNLLV